MARFIALSSHTIRALLCGLAVIVQPAGGGTPFQYGYDTSGRLVSMATGAGAVTYAYDAAGNLVQRVFSSAVDEDGDGLNAATEAVLGTNPHLADTDSDGDNDGAELAAGTDPLNAASRFDIASAAVTGGEVNVRIATVTGRRYTLQSSTALSGWVNEDEAAAVNVAGTGGVVTLRDLNPGTGRKFYRVLVSP